MCNRTRGFSALYLLAVVFQIRHYALEIGKEIPQGTAEMVNPHSYRATANFLQ